MRKLARTKPDSGARGDQRGLVRNVSPLVDREEVMHLFGDPATPPAAEWVVVSDDTDNLAKAEGQGLVGRYALQFDKVDGTSDDGVAGVKREDLKLDLSRFLEDDQVVALVYVPSLTDVAFVQLYLGTSFQDSKRWSWLDTELREGWNVLAKPLEEGDFPGSGFWDPANVSFCQLHVSFDDAADTLVGMRVGGVYAQQKVDRGTARHQFGQLNAPGAAPAFRCGGARNHTFLMKATNVDTDVTFHFEGSLNGTDWDNLAAGGGTITVNADGTTMAFLEEVPLEYVRPVFDAETGGTAAELDCGYMGAF